MKKDIIVTSLIFMSLLVVLALPIIFPVSAGQSALFNVSLTISNAAPAIVSVDSISDTPAEGTTKLVTFFFNASDSNGVSDIPASNALVIINRSGVSLTSGTCITVGTATSTMYRYECNVSINYYNLPGAWTINASVYDGASARATDTSAAYTNGNVFGISLKTNSLTFSGSPGQNDVSASNNPQTVNNTGNNAITSLNLTAFNLASGSQQIGAGNFSVNVSDSAIGQTLGNNTLVAVTASSVAVQGTKDLYIYLDVPSGISNGTYTSTSSWIVGLNG